MKSFISSLVGLTLIVSTVGCCGIRVVHNGSHAPHGLNGFDCDTCGVDIGAPVGCDDGCCGPGLLGRVGDRLRAVHCNSGCGEVYWDEQINEPRVCDPCCFNGDYVGHTNCGRCPGGLARFRELWGFRYYPSDCGTCASGTNTHCTTCGTSEQVYEQFDAPVHQPQRQQSPTPASRPQPKPATPPAAASTGEEIRSVVEPSPGASTRATGPSTPARVVSQTRASNRNSVPRLSTR